MAVYPNCFLDFAKDCLNRDDEIGFRNAAARAYYAAYHEISTKITSLPESHSMTIKNLLSSKDNQTEKFSDETLRYFGHLLKTMKKHRQLADYKINYKFTLEQAKSCINNAEEVMALTK